jgi:hypothetical protein
MSACAASRMARRSRDFGGYVSASERRTLQVAKTSSDEGFFRGLFVFVMAGLLISVVRPNNENETILFVEFRRSDSVTAVHGVREYARLQKHSVSRLVGIQRICRVCFSRVRTLISHHYPREQKRVVFVWLRSTACQVVCA